MNPTDFPLRARAIVAGTAQLVALAATLLAVTLDPRVGLVAAVAIVVAGGVFVPAMLRTVRAAEAIASAMDALLGGDRPAPSEEVGLPELDRLSERVHRLAESVWSLLDTVRVRSEALTAAAGALESFGGPTEDGGETSDVTRASRSLSEAGESLGEIVDGSKEMSEGLSDISSRSEQMSENMQRISVKASEVSSGVNVVAASMEEMSAAIREVSTNAAHARELTAEARGQARTAGETMTRLDESSQTIGRVTEVIRDIADQTSLLALNATIEAARAGAAGKGFGVVAYEVKALAAQSMKAADEISSLIEHIQSTANDAVGGMEILDTHVKRVDEMVDGIATATSQQESAASEIASAVTTVSADAEEISRNVARATEHATEVAGAMSRMSGASVALFHTGMSAAEESRAVSGLLSAVQSRVEESNEQVRLAADRATELARIAEGMPVSLHAFSAT